MNLYLKVTEGREVPPLAVGLSHTPSRARGQRALNLAMRVPTLQPGKISALGRKPCESCLS